jgi:clan AA aspartic protease (TIGR02281 family)
MKLFNMALALTLGILTILPAYAKEDSPQMSEATLFFNQLLHETKNPLIANMAQESLKRLQTQTQQQAQSSPASASHESKRQIEVPLIGHMNNSLAVPVILNQKAMGTFIVDTGATFTVITPRMAEKLGVQVRPDTPRIKIVTANGVINAPLVKLDQVAIGGVEVSNLNVVVQDLGNDTMLSGLLGMSFFKNMDLTIKKNKLILSISQAY